MLETKSIIRRRSLKVSQVNVVSSKVVLTISVISVLASFIRPGKDIVIEIGLSLAIAVAFDAFVVRMTIVPAVLALPGDHAWKLPAWLNRLLPETDVEGATLADLLDAEKTGRHGVLVRKPVLTGARSAYVRSTLQHMR